MICTTPRISTHFNHENGLNGEIAVSNSVQEPNLKAYLNDVPFIVSKDLDFTTAKFFGLIYSVKGTLLLTYVLVDDTGQFIWETILMEGDEHSYSCGFEYLDPIRFKIFVDFDDKLNYMIRSNLHHGQSSFPVLSVVLNPKIWQSLEIKGSECQNLPELFGPIALFWPQLAQGTTKLSWNIRIVLEEPYSKLLCAHHGNIPQIAYPNLKPKLLEIELPNREICVSNVSCLELEPQFFDLNKIAVYIRTSSKDLFFCEIVAGKVKTLLNENRFAKVCIENELIYMYRFFTQLLSEIQSVKFLEVDCGHLGAQSFLGLITFHRKLVSVPATLIFRYLPHEMAHQWIGNRIRIEGCQKYWLLESFPEFLQLLYLRTRFDNEMYQAGLDYCRKIASYGLLHKSDNSYDANVCTSQSIHIQSMHAKFAQGTLIWDQLLRQIGHRIFVKAIKELLKFDDSMSVENFFSFAESLSDRSLSDIRRKVLDVFQ